MKENTLTAHEALSALVYLVTGGYALYLGWFLIRSIRDTPNADRTTDPGHKTTRAKRTTHVRPTHK